jgi:hypothetical protein
MPRAAASPLPRGRTDRPADGSSTFSIGELAREFGLTTRAIRFYEDCGLLAPQRAAATASTRRATGRASR